MIDYFLNQQRQLSNCLFFISENPSVLRSMMNITDMLQLAGLALNTFIR